MTADQTCSRWADASRPLSAIVMFVVRRNRDSTRRIGQKVVSRRGLEDCDMFNIPEVKTVNSTQVSEDSLAAAEHWSHPHLVEQGWPRDRQ